MAGNNRGLLRSLLRLLAGLLGLIVIAALIVGLFRIPIDLTGYKALVESTASDALGRTVTVDGSITVTTSFWPSFEIQGMRIANPDGFEQGELASMKHARISLALLPLLSRKIHFPELHVEGLALNLVRDERGAVNWILGRSTEVGPAPREPAAPNEQLPALSSDALAVDELLLENVSVTFRDGADGEERKFALDQAAGSASAGEPMILSLDGVLFSEPYTVRMEANSLGEFLAMTRSRLKVDVDIAGTELRFVGLSDALGENRNSELALSVSGERLDSLDDLLGLDLPPLADYRLGAQLVITPGRVELNDLEVSVGSSTVSGMLAVDRTGAKPVATIQLTAETIQLGDFETGDWSADEPQAEQAVDSVTTAAAAPGDPAKLLSPEALQSVNARLGIRVAQVWSGEDALGSGELTLELKDGRISLDPLQLTLPGSRLLLRASVKPDAGRSDAMLRVLVENFDFGALARLSNPDSDLGGTLNVDIDVTAQASGVNDLMSGANGYLDIAGHPENLRSGIVDLWAVNLLSSVVSSSLEGAEGEAVGPSQINCIISRWSLADGVMTARNLAVDTSKIRICGEGDIDFNERRFRLTASPKAKRPEFFSLATPVAVTGKFEDFRVGMESGLLSIGATAARFAISPITTPLKRLVHDDLPEDGSDICGLPIGSHEEGLSDLPGC